MGRPRKTEEPVKERKTRTKKVEEPEVKTEQIEDPVLDEKKEDIPELAADPEIKPTEYIVNVREDSWLNVRRGPGRNFEAVAKLKNGESVFVYEQKDGFARIGDDVWVDTKFLISIL